MNPSTPIDDLTPAAQLMALEEADHLAAIPEGAARRLGFRLCGDFLLRLSNWLTREGRATQREVYIRTWVYFYSLQPTRFSSQSALATALGVDRKIISTTLRSFTDEVGCSIPGQRTAGNRAKLSQAKKEYYARKKR